MAITGRLYTESINERKAKKWVLFVAVLLITNLLQAQEEEFGFCQKYHNREKIEFVKGGLPDSLEKIMIVTNRPVKKGESGKYYLENDIERYRKVTYLLASCTGEKWLIQILPDFLSAIQHVDVGQDLLLFVHGHGKTFCESITRAYQTHNRYDVPLILFDWPSENNNFNKSIARVRRCGENFYNLLLNLKEYREHTMDKDQHISLFAHSLGNYYISHLVVNGNWQYIKEPLFENVIFNAPAIQAKNHGEIVSRLKIGKRYYVAFNHNDKVLRGAQLITWSAMLGNVAMKPKNEKVRYVNFTDIAEKEHTYFAGYHEFEYNNKGLFYFYNTAVHGGEVNLEKHYFKVNGKLEFMVNPLANEE